MNEQEYLAQRTAIEVVHDYIVSLEETLDHLGNLNNQVYYEESEAREALDALAELSE